MNITNVLSHLDPGNDAHWTSDDMPRMDVVEKLMGDTSVTRKMVTDAAPDFTRDTARANALPADAAEVSEDKPEDNPEVVEQGPGDTQDEADPPTIEQQIADAIRQATPGIIKAAEEAAKQSESTLSGAMEAEDPVAALGELPEAQEVYILDMPIPEMCQTLERMEAWQVEANNLSVQWQKEKGALEVRIQKMSKLSASISARQQHMKSAEPNHDTAPIRAYLKRQAEVREQRAARAQAFLDKGINQGVLTALISGKSKLDLALNQRKPAPGSTRPDPRMPVRGVTRGF